MLVAFLGAGLAVAFTLFPSPIVAIVALTTAVHLAMFPLARRAIVAQRRLRTPDGSPPDARSMLAVLGPALLQAPVFITMFQLLRSVAGGATTMLPASSDLAGVVRLGGGLRAVGVDLGQTGLAALVNSPASAALFIGLIGVAVVASVAHQRRTGVDAGGAGATNGGRLVAVFPLLAIVWGLSIPLAVTVYTTTSSVLRLVQDRLV